MRFLYVRLENYIGLYNGSGLEVLELDFSKARNKITVISGENGTGKSTIIDALNILPDGNEMFVPLKNASKYIKLTDGINIYDITFNHPVDKHGNRAVTKVSLLKNGIEINPNGNVGSYKDIIFNEFDIDGNFLLLSKVSGTNRGLADKKPAERKKIMASLISSLEVYNEIYKNLNKKSNIFKSYVNNLASKIQSVGDEELLKATISSIDSKEQYLKNNINVNRDKIVELRTILSMRDPDGSLQNKYDSLINNLFAYENETNRLYLELAKFKDSNSIDSEHVDENIDKNNLLLKQYSSEYQKCISDSNAILLNINSTNSDIVRLEAKINKLSENIDGEIEQKLLEYSNKMNEIEHEFDVLGIKSVDDISQSDIERIIDVCTKIISYIDQIYDFASESDLKDIYENRYIRKEQLISQKEICEDELSQRKLELAQLKSDLQLASVLNDRPKKCKDDSCIFVKASIDKINEYGNFELLQNKISDSESDINIITDVLNDLKNNKIPKSEEIESLISILEQIANTIFDNRKIISQFKVSEILTSDINRLICEQQYTFPELRDLRKFSNCSNNISEYKSIVKIVNDLSAKYQIQKNNLSLLDEYTNDYNEKKKILNSYNEEYSRLNKQKEFNENLCESIKTTLSLYEQYKQKYSEWKESENKKQNAIDEAERIKETFKSSLDILENISKLENNIKSDEAELNPLIEQRKSIDSQITMLESFKSEYSVYKEKYDYVTVLRNYSSPTSGSIQSLFMSIYMNKTLDTVNNLLCMLFRGEYRILEYVINEDEFRIPFIGNGLAVDDISSGSGAQVSMFGLMINLVLANMCSSKYNIVSLDEIDGALDSMNRYMFVDVLNKISEILNFDQIFIISHSIEASLNNVDVISLSTSTDYKDMFSNANIIFQK